MGIHRPDACPYLSITAARAGAKHPQRRQAMSDPQDLARRYIHIWNEADPAARRAAVAALWIENGTHYVRERQVHGHADLETRVATSHQTNVAERNYWFEPDGGIEQLRDMVKFKWRMVPRGAGAVAATGSIVCLLADDGRIRIDYQFIDPD
jgi:hypothetical protein